MRLPEKADGSFDYVPMEKMVDRFLEAGFTYFDTVKSSSRWAAGSFCGS
jgi:predicted aldo/keto reductase-like oxidoreductase